MPIGYVETGTDADGGSAVWDVVVDSQEAIIEAGVPPMLVSRNWVTGSACFVEVLPGSLASDWHPSPARQFTVVLSGVVEIETTDGQVRRLHPGDVALAGDIDGTGHLSRVVEGDVRLLFVTLEEPDR